MKKLFSVIVIVITINVGFAQNKSIKKPDLIGCWKSYPEENKFFPEFQVFRPCDYSSIFEKKAKKFRFRMHLLANNICSYLIIGASDIPKSIKGKWEFDTKSKTLSILQTHRNFKVEKLEHDLLLVKAIRKN